MAYFRQGIRFAQRGLFGYFPSLLVLWLGTLAVPEPGQGQESKEEFYIVKQYPDGTKTKVKWENVGKTSRPGDNHGGAPVFRPPRQGELEKLKEELPEVSESEPPAQPLPKAGERAPPVSPAPAGKAQTAPRPAESAAPAVAKTVETQSKGIWTRAGERSSLPARMGPSVQYGQAYQDYGAVPFRLDPKAADLRAEEKAPPLPPEATRPFLPALGGLVLWEEPGQVQGPGVEGAEGVQSHVSFLPEPQAKRLLNRFLKKPVSMATLGEIRQVLLAWLAAQGKEVVSVIVPEQEIRNGILQVLVLSGRMGTVRVEGNRYFSSENLRAQIRQPAGESLDLASLGEDAGWLNSNPFRQVQTSLAPGADPGTTDVVLEVQDRFPLRPFVSYDNFGVQSLGYDRYSLGLTLMDVWTGLDQKFDYQYLTSGGFSKLKANSGAWAIALPWRHTASIFGSYSLADPDASGQLDFNSYYWQTSFRYNFLLPDLDLQAPGFGWRHQFYIGFDFKSANSDVFFAGTPIPPSTNGLAGLYNIAQFPFGYTATITDPLGSTGVECAGFWSPGGISADNSNASFQQINGGATADYLYGKFLLNRVFLLPKAMSLVGNLQIQQSNRTLMPTESFGIGGYDTVRGYDQRSANGDNAYLVNVEFRSPGISFGQELGEGEFPDQLVLLGFFDYGQVLQVNSDTTTSVNWTLASVGPGLRYSIGPWFQVRFDWGFQLKPAPAGTTGGAGGPAGTSQAVLSASLAY